MRRYITVTVCTMIMLAALGMIFLMRNKFPEGNSFYITVNSQDGSSEMILPFDTEDDCAVFVLPSYAKIEEATFTSDGMDIVGSNGTILVSSGMKCTSVSVNCKYELTVPNDANRKVLFLQSDGVAAMYIDTSEEELEIAENRLTADDRDFLFCLDDARRIQGMGTAFLLNPGIAAEINHPDPCTQEEETILKDHLMEMQNAFLQKEGSGSDPSWKDYIDLDSWARKYLVEEIFLNFDAGAQSQYFLWRREEDKIYAGPCWDYDNILGVFGYGMTPRSFYARRIWKTSEQYTPWLGALWEKEEFAEYVKQLYRAEFLPELNRLLEKGIKKEADHIRNAANADRVRWPFLFKNHGSFQEAVDFMTDFLARRTDFLSSAWIDNVEYCTITLKIPGDYYRFYCVRPGTVCQELPTPENFGLEGVKYWTYEDTGEIFSYGTTIREDLVLFPESKPQE